MKRPFSPLVWLCAAGTIALGALTAYDPAGVYADYAAQLGDGTPSIAAVFTAAQDGVWPWSFYTMPEEVANSPAYRLLTDTVTDEEMRSSVGNDEPFRETPASEAAAPDAAVSGEEAAPVSDAPVAGFTPSVEIVAPDPPAPADTPVEPAAGFFPIDESWFDDAVFIGDSHIEGFCDYAGLRNATYYYKRGLDIWSVMKKAFVGGRQTIPQAMAERTFGKIYIMLGINEIGVGTTESYAAQYADVVAQLRELQPDALIYIQAIFHTSQKKSDSTIYNNGTINARNEAISRIADGEHVFFIDCNAVFDDENGALTPTYSGDGVHVKAPYYTMWRDYLFQFGHALPEPAVEPAAGEDAVDAEEEPVPDAPALPDVESVSAPLPESVVSAGVDAQKNVPLA